MENDRIYSHKDLKVWQEAMNLVEEVYVLSQSFPDAEKFGLTGQIRRSAVSIPSNMAEGFARKGNKELVQFLYIAQGSLAELETQLEIAFRIKYINEINVITEKIKFIRIMLARLISSIKNKP